MSSLVELSSAVPLRKPVASLGPVAAGAGVGAAAGVSVLGAGAAAAAEASLVEAAGGAAATGAGAAFGCEISDQLAPTTHLGDHDDDKVLLLDADIRNSLVVGQDLARVDDLDVGGIGHGRHRRGRLALELSDRVIVRHLDLEALLRRHQCERARRLACDRSLQTIFILGDV